MVHDKIRQYVKCSGRRVRVKAALKEGVKQYMLGFFNAREYAKTSLTVELLSDTAKSCLFTTTGEASYEVRSAKVDTTDLETLYRKSLKTSVYKTFESIRDFLAQQKPGQH